MELIKTYEAPNTIIANMVVFVSGKPRRVNFTPVSAYEQSSGRGSRFTTSNKELQDALEGHPLFNRKFSIYSKKEVTPVAEGTVKEDDITNVIKVSSPQDAREYLFEHFGIAKNKLRQVAFIKAAAKENGIIFDGI